jgi:quinol-cytochrome oxidoreductase complex cytochrome b subunit
MIARPRGKPIHFLQNVKRWVWILIFGGALVFMAFVFVLAALHPNTPANQLVTWANGWFLLIPAGMVATGFYISARWWRCPQCGWSLPTNRAIPEQCRRCGNTLRDF